MKLSLERQIPLAFIVALILLVTISLFAYRQINELSEAVKWEKHTQEVLQHMDGTLALIVDAESSGRGFVISGNEDFLESYNRVNQLIGENIQQLKKITADNREQTQSIVKLEKLIYERLDLLKQFIVLRRTQGLNATISQVTGRGKNTMDEIRGLIAQMKDREKSLLAEREAELDNSISGTYRLLILGSIAGIFSLLLANLAIFRETGKRSRAEEELKLVNRDLENRVGERTAELSATNEQLTEMFEKRRESEERHRTALEAGALGTWKLSLDGSDGEMDERSLSVFGLSSDDFQGTSKAAFTRIIEEDAALVDEKFRRAFREKDKFETEFRIRDSKGSIRWNQCTGSPRYDENGNVTHLVGFCRDITESKESELTIKRNAEFIRTVLDSLPAHIAVLDKDGTIVEVNRAWNNFSKGNCIEPNYKLTGIGQNYLQVCEKSAAFDEGTRLVVENLREILRGRKKEFSFEYPCHSPSEERWFILQASAMENGAVVSHIDISERKRHEAELKNSEEFNRSIFENSPDCVKVLELDGTLHAMNTNGMCIMEIDDFAEFKGKIWADFWSGEEYERVVEAVEEARQGKTVRFEGYTNTAKGSLKYWDVTVAPVFDNGGKVRRIISTSRDITEHQKARLEREKLLEREKNARKDAEVANRLRDEFLATVSHELRAPLNSILGWSRLMQQGKLDEKTTPKAVGTIVRNAEAQSRLIEDLLDVSRIISGKLRLEVMTVKPISFVESALETVRPAAEAKNIMLEVVEDSGVSHISGDPNRLQQVVWNLLSNAIKFTPNDGKVTVKIKRTNGDVEIRVRDTGIGIKSEFLPHVFDRFSQADASSIRKFGGLGLGLAIVRHLTEMHGGTVRAESEGENKGSVFVVKLPVVVLPQDHSSTIEINQSSKPVLDLSLDGLLILVVDDEEDARQLMAQTLTHYGATVITADSAENALKALNTQHPDVLVSDIGMPDEDGYSLIRKVRLSNIETPAVALTAFTRAQDRMRALSSGFQNHVAKPIEPEELVTVIASLTGRLQINEGKENIN